MAQRYGGAHSPNGARPSHQDGPAPHRFKGRAPTRLGGRVNTLFVLPWLFAIPAFFGDAVSMVLNLAAFALMMGAAWMTREGLRAEAAFMARAVAARPAIPRKLLGALAMGAGLGLATVAKGAILEAGLLGALGAVLHLVAFGIDPLHHKGIQGEDFQSSRVAKAVSEAEAALTAISAAIAPLRDHALAARVETFQITARDMFRTVEQDPRDLTAARKYLGVYLHGTREATERYAALAQRGGDHSAARRDYLALLDDLDRTMAAKTQTLLQNDRDQLDIDLAVLRDRLARETTPTTGARS